ncbi:unnamed protein product [Protopolystoma xenopodis]|uniref:Uncharacterized protein n=1 Tax=Protopolystoma xenopodis TaxID=117903 RepID=A0A3S5CRL2_9PLAT|nr:unnamed protein product [Protopolystoma xenopodis]
MKLATDAPDRSQNILQPGDCFKSRIRLSVHQHPFRKGPQKNFSKSNLKFKKYYKNYLDNTSLSSLPATISKEWRSYDLALPKDTFQRQYGLHQQEKTSTNCKQAPKDLWQKEDYIYSEKLSSTMQNNLHLRGQEGTNSIVPVIAGISGDSGRSKNMNKN